MTPDDATTPLPPPLPTTPGIPGGVQLPYPSAYQPVAWTPVPQTPPPPRVWPAIVVPVVAGVAALAAATAALVVAAFINLGPGGMTDQAGMMDWIKSYGATPVGFLVLVLPGQLAFLAAGITAALLSPVPFADRLGLRAPSVSWWIILLLLPANVFAGVCGDLLMRGIFGAGSTEHLEMLYNLFRGRSGFVLVMVTVAVSVLPGLSEELLFRGYSQRRLLQRWHPAAAIAVSSTLFAAAHVDPAHVVAVLPLGIWFGVIAWLTGSIWPSVICHTVNNALAVLLTNAGHADPNEQVQLNAAGLTMLATSGACVALSVWVMWRSRKPQIPAAAAQAF